jgi:hypothetical protein
MNDMDTPNLKNPVKSMGNHHLKIIGPVVPCNHRTIPSARFMFGTQSEKSDEFFSIR